MLHNLSGVWAAFLRNDLSNIIFIQETCSVMIILELVLLDYFLFYFYPFLIALCVD